MNPIRLRIVTEKVLEGKAVALFSQKMSPFGIKATKSVTGVTKPENPLRRAAILL
jgi:hypothetical protein